MRGLGGRFAEHLAASGWLAEGAGVVVGVSGGVDSMTLMHLMRVQIGPPGVRLHAAHVDHRMREGSSDDAAWVGGICAEWGVQFHLCEADPGVTTEAEGRELRYAFLEEVRRKLGDGALTMTAHTADDQAETVLFRAARGSGPRGLAGIRAARPPSVVRPLLPFRRAEIEAYAAERGIPFREDPTNRDPRWTRNRLRHEILPALEEAVPGAGAALAALAGTSRAEADALDELLDERIAALGGRGKARGDARASHRADGDAPPKAAPRAFSLDRDALCALSAPMLAVILRRAVQRVGGDPGRGATQALVRFVQEARSGRHVAVAGGVVVERHLDAVRIGRERGRVSRAGLGAAPGDVPCRTRKVLRVNGGRGEGVVAGGGWVAEVVWGPRRPDGLAHVAFFAPNTHFPLTVRPWRPGDRVAMPYGRKKVKKLLLEARVTADVRQGLPIVADASGDVVWIPGVVDPAIGETGAADPDREGAGTANPAPQEARAEDMADPVRQAAARPGCWVAIRLRHQSPGP
ncbi:MAG: tRNA lysidine(34) synthetase TilS [Gemmatimonadota bacterium]|nr:tRNA lysidine(34) synthetase TilS [Gemmatimonadota bacterium]